MHLPPFKDILSDFRHLSLHVSPGGSAGEQRPYGMIHFMEDGFAATLVDCRMERQTKTAARTAMLNLKLLIALLFFFCNTCSLN